VDKTGNLGDGESRVRYFVHKCLNNECSRMLYVVLNAENLCFACFHPTIAIAKGLVEGEDGQDEEEGED